MAVRPQERCSPSPGTQAIMNPTFDLAPAHQHFSANCFNRAWELMEKPRRTTNDDRQMLLLSLSSLWHWTQRADCTARHLSVGCWQASRVFALLGQAQIAADYGEQCLSHSASEPPFYRAYAHEALARAALAAGDFETLACQLQAARRLAAEVGDGDERALLERDLESLESERGR